MSLERYETYSNTSSGESSVFSIFLPRGMRWMAEKLGRDFTAQLVCFKALKGGWRPTVESFTSTNPFTERDILGAGEETPLPMRDVVEGYVNGEPSSGLKRK